MTWTRDSTGIATTIRMTNEPGAKLNQTARQEESAKQVGE
jgi:hypothetical protein